MLDLRRLLLPALIATTACTAPAADPDDGTIGCTGGKCDGTGGAEQLAELTVTPAAITGSDPHGFVTLGSRALFFSGTRKGLWSTDGTAAGTKLVRDLDPLPFSWQNVPAFAVLGAKAYWSYDGEVWMTDGTPAGTALLFDTGSTSTYVSPVAVVGTTLVFGTGDTLYVSDGTPAGTHAIAALGAYAPFVAMGSKVYFRCNTAATGSELCATDLTAAGTHLVTELQPGIKGSEPAIIGAIGTKLVFAAIDNYTDLSSGLYASDGTAAGTVKLIPSQPHGDTVSRFTVGTAFDGALYFDCYTAAAGSELCKTDGTAAGTEVLDLVPGATSSVPTSIAAIGDTLVYTATTAAYGTELWASDGTVAGATRLTDIWPGPTGGISGGSVLRKVGDQLLFVGWATAGTQLWTTDGTAAGTHAIATMDPGSLADGALLGDQLVFASTDAAHGVQPWITDGTAAGTKMIADLPGLTNLLPYEATTFGGGSYFAIGDNVNDTVWRTDGTAAGTTQLHQMRKEISPMFTAVGSALYFRGEDALWKTTGGAATKVSDLPGSIEGMAALGNQVAFTGVTPSYGYGLWFSDGTAAGTTVATIDNAESLGVANGRAWLSALSSAGNELWSSDGTVAGTQPVADLNPGGDSRPSGFVALGGKTLFSAQGPGGYELYVTDGTAAGTHQVADIRPGAVGSNARGLFPFGQMVLFWANPTDAGEELWRTDGTAAGTRRVKAVPHGDQTRFVGNFVAWGDQAFFVGLDAAGSELWRTDGTEAGTVRVADIYAGPRSSYPGELALAGPNGPLYFAAEEPVGGRELWRLDTPSGTPQRALDLVPGPGSSSPLLLQPRGGALVFVALTGADFALFRLGDVPGMDDPDAPGDDPGEGMGSGEGSGDGSGSGDDDGGSSNDDVGCAAGGGSAGTLGLVLAVLALRRRRTPAS